MADSNILEPGTFEVVGEGVQEPTKPTRVPKSAPAPSEAISAVTGGQPASPPMAEPAQAPATGIANNAPIDSTEYQVLDPLSYEELPTYADGSAPSSPINRSPLDAADRLKLVAGNKVGTLKYLKEKFGDAAIDRRGNFVVQKDGSWYRVDAQGLGDGDAWQRSKELLGDFIDTSYGGLQGAVMSAKGGPMAALAGYALGALSTQAMEAIKEADFSAESINKALAGTGIVISPMIAKNIKNLASAGGLKSIGGAGAQIAALEGIRTSLGRIAGTYDATPEEQLKDIGLDAMFAMGGQALALGAVPSLGRLKSSLEDINSSATNYVKERLSSTWASLIGRPREAVRAALDAPEKVINTAQEFLKQVPKGHSPTEAVPIMAQSQAAKLTALAEKSKTQLSSVYRQELSTLIKDVPDTFSANVKAMTNETKLALREAGYGKIVGNPGNEKFLPLSTEEIAAMVGVNEAQLPKIIGPDTRQALNKVAGILNEYGKIGALTGKQGAAKTVELKRALNESFSELLGENTPESIQRVVMQAKKSMETSIGKVFAKNGVGEKYIKMNNNYAQYKDAVDMVNKAVNSKNPNDIDNLVKKLVSKSGSFGSLKEEAKSLANLVGHDTVSEILNIEHAKSFVDLVPQPRMESGGGSLGALGKLAAGSLQQTNPRAVAAQIKYGTKAVDFLKSMGPRQMKNFLGDEQAVESFFRTIGAAAATEDQASQELLKQAGM